MKAYIRVRCNKRYLSTIRDFMHSKLEELQVDRVVSNRIILAVDEACANCMIHQHHCDNYSTIEIAIYRQKETLYTEIKDTGKAFPIHEYKPRPLQEIVSKRIKGGLGINLIHRIMDEVKVEERQDYFIYRFGKYLDQEVAGQA